MPKHHRKKKRRTHRPVDELEDNTPKTFILATTGVSRNVKRLMFDFRQVMEPYTATRLRVRKSNSLKDFVNVAGPMGISHFLIFNQTETGTNLRVVRTPHGPTITFRVEQYSLIRDVHATLTNPKALTNEYEHPPLVVLNNFPQDESYMKMVITMLQNMFPTINIQRMTLATAKRVVLFNYDSETSHIQMRHYLVNVTQVGLSKSVKRVIQTKIPDLKDFTDISDYILREAAASESDAEEDNKVMMTASSSKDATDQPQKKSVKLQEIGPRMDMQLIKIEKDFCEGEVMYHRYVYKSQEAIEATRLKQQQKASTKAARRAQQESNIRRKQEEKEKSRKSAIETQLTVEARKRGEQPPVFDDEDSEDDQTTSKQPMDEEDDDTEYYRQEVGEEPDADFISSSKHHNRNSSVSIPKRFQKGNHNNNNKRPFNKRPRDGNDDRDSGHGGGSGGSGGRPFKKARGGGKPFGDRPSARSPKLANDGATKRFRKSNLNKFRK